MTRDLQLVALHEAGHAVAHVRLGIQQSTATIKPTDWTTGAVTGEGVENVWSAEQAAPMVEAYCAGYAALVAAGYGEKIAQQCCDSDFEHAAHLIEFWQLTGDIEQWKSRAVALMSAPENTRAAQLVAEHLLIHETLDDGYLDVLVELADGNRSEQEFPQYLQFRAHCNGGAA